MSKKWRRAIGTLVLLPFSLGIGLAGAEVLTRTLYPQPTYQRYASVPMYYSNLSTTRNTMLSDPTQGFRQLIHLWKLLAKLVALMESHSQHKP